MPSKPVILRAVALALVVSTLAGCGIQPTLEAASASVSRTQETTQAKLAQARTQAATAAVVRHKGPRLNGLEVTTSVASKQLPSVFREDFPYRSASQNFEGVMSDIARSTGMSVRKSVRPAAAGLQASSGQHATPSPRSPGYTWSGPLSGFLDQLSRSNDLFWRFEEKTSEIVFFREETRSFSIHVPTTENSVSASIALAGAGGSESGGGGSSGGAGGAQAGGGSSSTGNSSGNVSVTGTSRVNAFESVLMGVRGYVLEDQALAPGAQTGSPQGAVGQTSAANRNLLQVAGVIGNEGLGMVTVTATPPTLDRIAAYIDNVNKRFARNIYIGVRIYNLTVDDEAVSGLSISAAISNLAGNRAANIVSSGMLAPTNGTPGQFTVRLANAGSSVDVVAQALRTLGNVSLAQSAQVIAANGQPAPFQIADDVTFLESSTSTVVPNVGVTTSLTPGTRTVGLTGNLVPRFLNDNRLLLQYQLNLSSMTLSEVRSGNSILQTPRIARQALQQQAYLDDGESLVLFGFEQKRSVADDSSGVLTISKRGSATRTMVVIVMDVFGDAKARPLRETPHV